MVVKLKAAVDSDAEVRMGMDNSDGKLTNEICGRRIRRSLEAYHDTLVLVQPKVPGCRYFVQSRYVSLAQGLVVGMVMQ